MAKDYLALIDPMGNPVPIVRQGALVYLCPTVIPYAVADAARMAASCLPEVMDGIENELGSLKLRGVTDMEDGSIDHLFQLGALVAAAQEMKAKEGYRWVMWEVNESALKLIRHVRVFRNEMLDPRIKLANAWNARTSSNAPKPAKKAKTMASGNGPATVLSEVANALNPGAEVVLRMNANAKAK